MKTTIVGIGNVLLGDDGAGVWLARALIDRYRFDGDVEVLDGGTLGLGLVSYLCDTGRLLVIDAYKSDEPPGTIVVLHDADVPAVLRGALSAHEASLCDLLAAMTLLDVTPASVTVVGIVPAVLAPGVELSGAVRAALPSAEREVLRELAAWDVAATALPAPAETVLAL